MYHKKQKNVYLNGEHLLSACIVSKEIDNAVPNTDFLSCFLLIAENFIKSPKFNGYPPEIKQDMKSHCLEKLMKNFKNIKTDHISRSEEEKTAARSVFNYCSRICHCAVLEILNKYYSYENLKRELFENYVREYGDMNPNSKLTAFQRE